MFVVYTKQLESTRDGGYIERWHIINTFVEYANAKKAAFDYTGYGQPVYVASVTQMGRVEVSAAKDWREE